MAPGIALVRGIWAKKKKMPDAVTPPPLESSVPRHPPFQGKYTPDFNFESMHQILLC